jgi:hypothetical protein
LARVVRAANSFIVHISADGHLQAHMAGAITQCMFAKVLQHGELSANTLKSNG